MTNVFDFLRNASMIGRYEYDKLVSSVLLNPNNPKHIIRNVITYFDIVYSKVVYEKISRDEHITSYINIYLQKRDEMYRIYLHPNGQIRELIAYSGIYYRHHKIWDEHGKLILMGSVTGGIINNQRISRVY